MRGVGHCECEISNDIAHGALRSVYWDMWVRVTTRTDHIPQMGVVSQVTNCDWFTHETGKRVAVGQEMSRTLHGKPGIWTLNGQPLKPFIGYSGQIRESLETRGKTLPIARLWRFVPFSVWVQLYTSVESWKPRVPRDRTVQLFFLSIPMVVWMMDYEHFGYNDKHLYL